MKTNNYTELKIKIKAIFDFEFSYSLSFLIYFVIDMFFSRIKFV